MIDTLIKDLDSEQVLKERLKHVFTDLTRAEAEAALKLLSGETTRINVANIPVESPELNETEVLNYRNEAIYIIREELGQSQREPQLQSLEIAIAHLKQEKCFKEKVLTKKIENPNSEPDFRQRVTDMLACFKLLEVKSLIQFLKGNNDEIIVAEETEKNPKLNFALTDYYTKKILEMLEYLNPNVAEKKLHYIEKISARSIVRKLTKDLAEEAEEAVV